jgi:hypothetical protein
VRAGTVLRFYHGVTVALVTVWAVSLYVVLRRPGAFWLEAANPPLLCTLSIWLTPVMRARARVAPASGAGLAVRPRSGQYVAATLAVARAIAAFVIGFGAY